MKNKQKIKWNANQPIPDKSFSRPIQKKFSTDHTSFITKGRSFANVIKTNTPLQSNKNKTQQKNNIDHSNDWDILKEKIDRIENNLENAFKIINHLAEKLEVQLPEPIITENKQNKKTEQPENHSQEFNILNNRIDLTLDQFTQLKYSINQLANFIQKNNNINQQAMETEQNNNSNINDSTPN